MKIFHLRSSGGFYGAEAVILNAARELNRMGCDNHICCINNLKNPHAELADEALRAGINASSVDSISLLDWEAVKEIRETLMTGGFDIMHCHDYKASIYGLLASHKMNLRRVVTNHGWTQINLKLRFYEAVEGFSYNIFDQIVAVSDKVKKKIRPFILHRSKIEVIENGIRFEDFYAMDQKETGTRKRALLGISEHDCVIGVVGRLSFEKGHEYLLKAFKIFLEKTRQSCVTAHHHGQCGQRVRLLIVGDGPLEEQLKNLCGELGLSYVDLRAFSEPASSEFSIADVIFTGVQTDMPSVYPAMDILVMPSLEEGLPMTLLEAMASGVPVIATPVGHIPRIVRDGETGFLTRPRDAAHLAGVLYQVFAGEKGRQPLEGTGPALLEIIRKNARGLVREAYSAEAMAKKYLEIYEWLTE